jgi:hypothetical protein
MTGDGQPGAVDRAAALVADLVEGRFDEACDNFTEHLRRDCGGRLARGWENAVGKAGAYEGIGEPSARQIGDDTVVEFPLHFASAKSTGQVIFDRDGKVTGLHFQWRRRRLSFGGRWWLIVGRPESPR